jgi:hypothetical protein
VKAGAIAKLQSPPIAGLVRVLIDKLGDEVFGGDATGSDQ